MPSTMRALVDMLAAEFGDMNDAINEIGQQALIRLASWGITDLEVMYGLIPQPGVPLGQRQDRVFAKSLGPGTISLAKALQVANSYENGAVRIAVDPLANAAIVYFVSTLGVPANYLDLQAQLEDLLPARLSITFAYRYLLWDQMTATTRTWAQITADALTWDELIVTQPGAL